jgi:hypothetical protein
MISSKAQEKLTEKEIPFFTNVLNNILDDNPPLNDKTLVELSKSGRLFAKILNKIEPKFANEESFREDLPDHLIDENLSRLMLQSGNLGVKFGFVHVSGIMEGNINVILNFLSSLLKYYFVLQHHTPTKKDEEEILLEWLNNESNHKLKNFTVDLKNGQIYNNILEKLKEKGEEALPLQPNEILKEVVRRAKTIEKITWIEEDDLKNGGKIQNILACAAIYHNYKEKLRREPLAHDGDQVIRERQAPIKEKEIQNFPHRNQEVKVNQNDAWFDWSWWKILLLIIAIIGIAAFFAKKKQ